MIELAQFCGGVTPGISTVEYLPTAWVDRDVYVKLIDSAHNWQKEIITTQGDWMKAPLLPFGDLLNEVQKEGPSGPSWEVQVAGRTPKMLPTVTGTLARMARYRFLLRIQLREGGLPWIIGSLDAPLSFVYQAVADEGKNSYDLRWSAPIPHSMYSYNPVI